MPAPDRVDEAAAELYALVPGEFVAARKERADRARRAGDRAAAKAIGALRRPSRAAWALNLLARHRPGELGRFLELADGLRTAQREGRGRRLREMSGQRNQVVAALTREATALAAADGATLGADPQREITQTLHAALADEDAAALLATGRLSAALTSRADFSFTGGADDEPPEAAPAPKPAARKRKAAAGGEAAQAAGQRDKDASREHRRAVGEAERALRRARDAARRADSDLTAAQERVRQAERGVSAGEERVTDLTARLDQARGEQREAEERADRARERHATADSRAREAGQEVERAAGLLDRLIAEGG